MYQYYISKKWKQITSPELGALVFYGKNNTVEHVALALSGTEIIEAGGGDSTTRTREDAARRNAFVRVRQYNYRSDLIAILQNPRKKKAETPQLKENHQAKMCRI